MAFFIIGIILLVVALIAIIVAFVSSDARFGAGVVAVLGILLGLGSIISQTFYSQDTGQASVLVNVSGAIDGQETTPGFHGKAPWESVETFNIRNQQVSFVGNSTTNYTGGSAQGPEVTAQDSEGVSSNLDVSIRYSIVPAKVTDIYRSYHDEDSFVANYITQTIRSTVRKVPNSYQTIDLLTKQTQLQTDIQSALTDAFKSSGVTVDNVSLQEIRPPAAIAAAYAAAQQAQIQVTTEQANLQAAKVSAQQQVVQAQAQAQANSELSKSLTPEVLESRYIDTLKEIGDKGNTVVVPEGSTPFVQVTK